MRFEKRELFLRRFAWRTDNSKTEAFREGILYVAVPAVYLFFTKGPRKVFVTAWAPLGVIRGKASFGGSHFLYPLCRRFAAANRLQEWMEILQEQIPPPTSSVKADECWGCCTFNRKRKAP
jgi:hypothetical protein